MDLGANCPPVEMPAGWRFGGEALIPTQEDGNVHRPSDALRAELTRRPLVDHDHIRRSCIPPARHDPLPPCHMARDDPAALPDYWIHKGSRRIGYVSVDRSGRQSGTIGRWRAVIGAWSDMTVSTAWDTGR